MGGRKPEHDAEASTVAQHGAAATPVSVTQHTEAAGRDSQPVLDHAPGGTIGRYRLLERLGAGAMGVVWLAQDPQLDRRIAIKVVHPNLARSPDASSRLQREARAMAKLSHRAVVTVHDAGDVEGRLFLAMELVSGTSLGQLLRSRTAEQRRDWRKWLTMMLEAGRGLEAAHGANVLHRDFKPDNVLVDASGRVCVADFGLATLGDDGRVGTATLRTSRQSLLELTTTGALLGTPAYMSPQQLRGEEVDARADQFSFCVATYEAVYGERPFLPTDPDDALGSLESAIETGELPAAPADSTVPADVHEVLRRGLAADPEARWPSMTALLDALERAARVRSTAIRVAAPDPRTRPLVLVLAGGLAVGAIAVVVALIASRPSTPDGGAAPPPARANAKQRFEVSLRSRLALSPDGRRVAIGSDRIEVRELDGPQVWTMPLGPGEDVSDLELTNDDVKFGVRRESRVRKWRYATDGVVSEATTGPRGAWSGTTTIGELFYDTTREPSLIIVNGADIVRSWSPSQFVELVAISPAGTRLATIEADRFFGKLVIRDVVGARVLETPSLDSPTALAWLDEHALVYATGTSEQPRIWRVAVDDRIGPRAEVYGLEHGWFGELVFAAGRLLVSELNPRPRARLVDGVLRDLDAANVAVALAWTSNDEYLTWSRSTRRVERRTLTGELRPTAIELAGEAANATLSGDILIAAVRESSGREVVAYSLATGARLWSHPTAATLAVRCAEDLHPPCFALRRADHLDQLVTLDPETGAVGSKVLLEGVIDDVAVSADGNRLLLAPRGEALRELTADGVDVRRHEPRLSTIRSVAFEHDGGYLIAGTQVRANYAVGRVAPDGSFTILAQASNDLLSLVRPSPDGKRALVLARIYAPMVWELAVSP